MLGLKFKRKKGGSDPAPAAPPPPAEKVEKVAEAGAPTAEAKKGSEKKADTPPKPRKFRGKKIEGTEVYVRRGLIGHTLSGPKGGEVQREWIKRYGPQATCWQTGAYSGLLSLGDGSVYGTISWFELWSLKRWAKTCARLDAEERAKAEAIKNAPPAPSTTALDEKIQKRKKGKAAPEPQEAAA